MPMQQYFIYFPAYECLLTGNMILIRGIQESLLLRTAQLFTRLFFIAPTLVANITIELWICKHSITFNKKAGGINAEEF